MSAVANFVWRTGDPFHSVSYQELVCIFEHRALSAYASAKRTYDTIHYALKFDILLSLFNLGILNAESFYQL